MYATIIRVDDDVKEKKDLEKIILCDVPTKIYPKLETSFLNLVHNSGHPDIKLEKKLILKNYLKKDLIKKIFFFNLFKIFIVIFFFNLRWLYNLFIIQNFTN